MTKPKLAIFIVCFLIAGTGIYLYFFSVSSPTTSQTVPSSSSSQNVQEKGSSLQQFSSSLASFYWLNSKTNAIYFLDLQGKVYKTFGDGRDEAVSEQTLPGLHAITLSPDGTKILASFSYPLNTTFALFDTNTNSWERLPSGAVAATFDATSSKIAYTQSGSNAGIFILNLIDKKTVNIISLNLLDGTLLWNKPDELLFTELPSHDINPEVWSIDIKKKTLKQIGDRASAMYQFSADGNYGLKFTQPTLNNAELFLTDGGGMTITKLAFTTLPSKCAFHAQTLYCAIPREFPPRSVLPDDYLKEKIMTDDTFISYGLETGAFTILAQPETPVDADQLLVRGEQLLFRNRYDGKIYSISIK